MARCAALGLVLGAAAPALQAALDPHLRPIFATAWQRGLFAALGAFGGAGLVAGGLAWLAGPGPGPWGRRIRGAVATSIPALGLAFWVLASPRFGLPTMPRRIGIVLSSAELLLLGAFFLIQVAAIGFFASRGARCVVAVPRGAKARLSGAGLAIAAGLALAWGLAGTAIDVREPGTSPTTPGHVVLIGVDGMDWAHLTPLIERGVTPHLAALVEAGASGPLATFRPTISPVVWTTVATGQPPWRHGILHFLDAETNTPFTSNSRRVPAIWNLLSDRGVSVGVVGWWVTWPAETVKGAIVSSYSTPDVGTIKGALHAGLEGQTHPPELMRALEGSIEADIETGGAEMRAVLAGYRPPPADHQWQKRVRIGSWVLAADRMFSRAAVEIARRYDPSLLAVYLSATDTTAHLFCQSNQWRDEICRTVIEGAYAAVDRAVGRVLDATAPGATVLVVSDHGFDLVRGHEHGWLVGPPGVAIAAGPGIRAGARIEAATIYDVAPTILALSGAPLPIDQRGRPWLGVLDPERLAELELATGAGAVPQAPPDEGALRPRRAPGDDSLRERLRALGYID